MGRCYLRDLKKNKQLNFLLKIGREPKNSTKDQLKLQKKMFSLHIFEIAEGKKTGRDFNCPIKGNENLKGKMQRMKSQRLRF